MKFLITCILALSTHYIVNAELFTALATMKRALYIEKKLAEHLRSYVPVIPDQDRAQKVLKLADEYERLADDALLEPESYLANPVNAYMLCKRFTTELKYVKELLYSQALQLAFEDQLAVHKSELPNVEDFEGVIDALLRLQDTYEIPALQFVDGTFSPADNSPRMTASDCFEIGRYAYEKGDKYHALMWLLESLSSFELEGKKAHSMDKILLLDYLIYAADDQGNPRHALNFAHQLLDLKPENPKTVSRMSDVIRWLHTEIEKENKTLAAQRLPIPNQNALPPIKNKRVMSRVSTEEFRNYEALCRGEDVMPNPYENKLNCYYSTVGDNPLLILAPAKIEEMYKNPDLIVFHDVVSDREIEQIKMLSTPLLKRAVVHDPKTGKLVTAQYRVSRSSWLYDNDLPTIATISNRIGAITSIDMATAEGLQVVNYGIGGQYEPHFDHSHDDANQFELWRGNRIATWIYYLSDVPAGGYTVFTEIGVRVPPTKGTAAFWWNLKKNGKGDNLTRHAGCPVLAGSKWVANKWTHIRGQEWKRPCTLNEDE